MDARIVVEPMASMATMVRVEIRVSTKIDDLVFALKSLFNPATILAPLRNMGNSLTAVAPDFNFKGGMSALAIA